MQNTCPRTIPRLAQGLSKNTPGISQRNIPGNQWESLEITLRRWRAFTANREMNAIFSRNVALQMQKQCRKHPWKVWFSTGKMAFRLQFAVLPSRSPHPVDPRPAAGRRLDSSIIASDNPNELRISSALDGASASLSSASAAVKWPPTSHSAGSTRRSTFSAPQSGWAVCRARHIGEASSDTLLCNVV